MGQKPKEIKVVMHLPESGIHHFEKRICDFYATQVEKRLHSLPKSQKLEVLQVLMANFNT